MKRWMPLAMIAATSTSTLAQAGSDPASPPRRIRSVAVEADAGCPPATGDEVVVCYRADEPYRIPKRFRRSAEIAAADQSWVNRAAAMDEIGRISGGLPNTCSATGTGGQTGCTQAMIRAWAAERRAMARDAEAIS